MKFIRGTLPGIEGQHDISVLEGDTHICKWIAEHGRLDQDANMWPRMEQLGLINRESVVYDIVAYVGDCTAWYASKAKAVVAFEAYYDAFLCLWQNMQRYNGVFAIVHAYHGAVGNGEFNDGDVHTIRRVLRLTRDTVETLNERASWVG